MIQAHADMDIVLAIDSLGKGDSLVLALQGGAFHDVHQQLNLATWNLEAIAHTSQPGT